MRFVTVACEAGECVAACEPDERLIGAFCGNDDPAAALPLGLVSPTEVVCTPPTAGYTITATCLAP